MSDNNSPDKDSSNPPPKRRRGRQPRPSLLSARVKAAVAAFALNVGQPRVIEPAGFRDFRGWLSSVGDSRAAACWLPLVDTVLADTQGDLRAIEALKHDLVREIVRNVVIPRRGESSKLVSTNCGRQCARPPNGVTLMTILDRVFEDPPQWRQYIDAARAVPPLPPHHHQLHSALASSSLLSPSSSSAASASSMGAHVHHGTGPSSASSPPLQPPSPPPASAPPRFGLSSSSSTAAALPQREHHHHHHQQEHHQQEPQQHHLHHHHHLQQQLQQQQQHQQQHQQHQQHQHQQQQQQQPHQRQSEPLPSFQELEDSLRNSSTAHTRRPRR